MRRLLSLLQELRVPTIPPQTASNRYECSSGKIDNAREPSREDDMSESTKPEVSRAENDREPIASVPEPIDDVRLIATRLFRL